MIYLVVSSCLHALKAFWEDTMHQGDYYDSYKQDNSCLECTSEPWFTGHKLIKIKWVATSSNQTQWLHVTEFPGVLIEGHQVALATVQTPPSQKIIEGIMLWRTLWLLPKNPYLAAVTSALDSAVTSGIKSFLITTPSTCTPNQGAEPAQRHH